MNYISTDVWSFFQPCELATKKYCTASNRQDYPSLLTCDSTATTPIAQERNKFHWPDAEKHGH